MKISAIIPDKNTLLHLRFPFSFFLLPVFLFALSSAETIVWSNAIVAFAILHLLVFPSSNGYNSYNDRDQSSIGILKHPPPVSVKLFRVTLLMDFLAVFSGFVISPLFVFWVLLFVLVSRAYSYRPVRLKKYPVLSFVIVSCFQGGLVYLMSLLAAEGNRSFTLSATDFLGMAISTLFIGSIYPLTQIYQHQADKNDGVTTLSYKLGYAGTFIFSAVLFVMATLLVYVYFANQQSRRYFYLFTTVMLPVVVWFLFWFVKVMKGRHEANYSNTMFMNLVTATCMNLFFLFLIINRYGNWY